MNIDPNKPVGWTSITGMLTGGIVATVLTVILQSSPQFLGATVLFCITMGSIYGLVTCRIIEARVREDQGEDRLEVAFTSTEEPCSRSDKKTYTPPNPSEEVDQQADGHRQETHPWVLMVVIFLAIGAIYIIAVVSTGNIG